MSKSKAVVNSLDLLHQHTLASVGIGGDNDNESSASSNADGQLDSRVRLGALAHNHITLPDGCIKAVEALCDSFKYVHFVHYLLLLELPVQMLLLDFHSFSLLFSYSVLC